MPFDPSDFSVREATEKLKGLDLDTLKSLYGKELEGKHRTSMLSEVSRQMDLLLEEEEAAVEEPAAAEPVAEEPVVDDGISMDEFWQLRRHEKRCYLADGSGRMKRIG